MYFHNKPAAAPTAPPIKADLIVELLRNEPRPFDM
jgi:hypothetical protein